MRATTLCKEERCPQSALDALVLLGVWYGAAACNPTTVGRNTYSYILIINVQFL